MRPHLAGLVACALLGAACVTSDGYAQGEPPPPSSLPPPPPDAFGGYSGIPDGQWVLTNQYGWVWMPYSDVYAYVPPGGVGEPLEYLYYPSYGWSWYAAPWIWGVGPSPRFVHVAPSRFAWYQHGWWREPRRWRYTPAPEPRGRGWAQGARPAPPSRPMTHARPAPARPGAPAAPPAAQGRRGEARGGEGRGGERSRGAPAPARPKRGDDRGDGDERR